MDQTSNSFEKYATRRLQLETGDFQRRFPYCQPVDAMGVATAGREGDYVSFAHYDYLGLGSEQRVVTAARQALEMFGAGAGASRLVGGELSIHRGLEHELAHFLGVDDALTLVSGYATNVALLAHVMSKTDLIMVDQAAHNSIMVGTQLSRAQTQIFRHNDLDELSRILSARRSEFARALVVVEGLYSMDGDMPDLPRLIEICRRHDAWLMIDEAHSIGVLGKTGRGITEEFGVDPREVDIIVGTLSKALVTSGGFIAGRRAVIEWLRFTLPGFVYSVGLPPSGVAAARAALQILQSEPERVARLRANSRYFLDAAKRRNFDTGCAMGAAVIPILLPTAESAIAAAAEALAHGFYVPPIVQIAVPKNLPRLRFFVTERHRLLDIDFVLDVLARRHVKVTPPASHRRPSRPDVVASDLEDQGRIVEA